MADEKLAWAKETDGKLKHFRKLPLAFGHNKMRKWFGANVNIAGLLMAVARFISIIGIATSPFWIEYFRGAKIDFWNTFSLSGVLAVFLIFSWIHDNILSGRARRRIQEDHFDSAQFVLARAFHSLGHVVNLNGAGPNHDSTIDEFYRSMLEAIEKVSKSELGIVESPYFSVSLLVFDKNGKRVRIQSRSTLSRNTGISIPSNDTMAYFVGLSGREKVVNDFLNEDHPFPKEGLSEKRCPYRSIFLLPLLYQTQHSPSETFCVGVVTIDCDRPYVFWGVRPESFVLKLNPFLAPLRMVLFHRHESLQIGGN